MNSGSGTGSVAALSGMAVDERGRGGGLGIGELEEAAADLLGVLCLEDLYHPLTEARDAPPADSEAAAKASAWMAVAACSASGSGTVP